MKSTIFQLKFYFTILVVFVLILSITGFVVISNIPVEESNLGAMRIPILSLCVLMAISSVAVSVLAINTVIKKVQWYESLLDSLPFPISVTDMNMNWTFINRPVEQMLNVKRNNVIGKHCSNWGAGICNTDNCGINCLRNNKPETFFKQGGGSFKVYSSFINDRNNKKIGHIELVQDITPTALLEKQQLKLIEDINTAMHSFLAASNTIASGSQTLAAGTTQQSSTVESLLQSIASLTNQTNDNAKMAEKSMELAISIKENAEKGSVQMDRMITAVNEISNANHAINNVIKIIDDIAFQTNILALNASVEAARAGQHGKGFAVVAEEVRSLAEKSAQSAKDTGILITNSIEKASLGEQIAGETAASLFEIVAGISESAKIAEDIAKASGGQTLAFKNINDNIGQFAEVVQQNTATAQESAATSQELSGQAYQLQEMVSSLRKNK